MRFLCMHIQTDRVSLLAVSGIDPFLPALGDGFLQGDRWDERAIGEDTRHVSKKQAYFST